MSDGLLIVSFEGVSGDAGMLAHVRPLARRLDDHAAVALEAVTEGGGDDAEARGEWIRALCALPLPVLALAEGELGPRGLALLAAADAAFIGPQASLPAGWRDTPGLVPLLYRRLGPGSARALLTSAGDLAQWEAVGLVRRCDDPDREARTLAGTLGPEGGRRLKRALTAAQELTFAEALAFDLWLPRQDRPA